MIFYLSKEEEKSLLNILSAYKCGLERIFEMSIEKRLEAANLASDKEFLLTELTSKKLSDSNFFNDYTDDYNVACSLIDKLKNDKPL